MQVLLEKITIFFLNIEGKSQRKMAFTYTIIAQFFFTLMYLCISKLRNEYTSLQILNIRMIIGYVLNVMFCSINRIPTYVEQRSTFRLLSFRGIVGGISMASLFTCLSMMNISDGVVLINTNPIWTNFLAYIFLRERITRKSLILCFLSFFGIVLVSRPTSIFGEVHGDNHIKYYNKYMGSIFGLVGSLSISTATILVRKLSHELKCAVATQMQYYYFIGVMTSTILLLCTSSESYVLTSRFVQISILLALTGFIGQMFQARSLTLQKASIISPLQYLQVVLSFLQDIFLLNVDVQTTSIIGAILIIFCSIGIAF